MVDEVYALNRDGIIEVLDQQTTSDYLEIDGEADLTSLEPIDAQTLVVKFNSITDGRGFSAVKPIRQDLQYRGKIYASGEINPDQLSLAFQVGFDAVLVSAERWHEYSEASWHSAMNPAVNLSYSQTHSESLQSIWQHRHQK